MKYLSFCWLLLLYFSTIHAQVQEEWRTTYSYQQQKPFISKIAVDKDSNILLAIASEDSTFLDDDAITVKISKEGQVVWNAIYDTDTTLAFLHYSERPYDMVVDEQNNVYILGYEWVNTPESWRENLFLIKYDEHGRQLWRQTYYRGERSKVEGLAIQLVDNEIWLIGRFTDDGIRTFWGDFHLFLQTYERNNGELNQTTIYQEEGVTSSVGYDILINEQKDKYISANRYRYPLQHISILAYTDQHTLPPFITYESPSDWAAQLKGTLLNKQGSFILSLAEKSTVTPYSADRRTIVKSHLPNGDMEWEVLLDREVHQNTQLDQEDNLLLLTIDAATTDTNAYLRKYSTLGELLWTTTLSQHKFAYTTQLIVDQHNYSYCGGSGFIYCYSPDGELFWAYPVTDTNISELFLDHDNNLYYAGTTIADKGTVQLVKLKTPLSFLTSIPTNTTPNPALQVHYQPIHQQTTFTITNSSILEAQNTHLQLYNIQGQLVDRYTLNSGSLIISTAQWQSGLYLGTLVVDGEKVETVSFSVIH